MKKLWCVLPAIALALTGLLFMACPDGNGDDDPPLSGNITITPAGPVTVGTQLTANYTGNEQVSYQWKRDTTNVGTGPTYTPYDAGSYTVTVSAAGFTGKTSAAVTVTEDVPGHTHQWGDWVITRQPTETVDGEETRTCQLDPTHTQTQPIPATGGSGINMAELEDALRNAHREKNGVKEATTAEEVATGVSWVTAADMESLDDAIDEAEAAKDNAASQSDVDSAKAKLEGALAVFMAAKKGGTAPAITLSGTITVKSDGQVVPYVEIYAHSDVWSWSESIRLSTSAANSPWSIITTPFAVETEIFFRVIGHQTEFEDDQLFNIDVKDLSVSVKDTDKSNIIIDLANLRLITLSGTINVDYDGKPVSSMDIQVLRKSDGFLLSQSSLLSVGNNTPWSMAIEAFVEETEVVFTIVGSSSQDAWSAPDRLFVSWNRDFGVKVKDQNVSDIALDLNFITMSGTLNVNYDGKPVPSVVIQARNRDDLDLLLGESYLLSAGNNTPWSIAIEPLDEEMDVVFHIVGSSSDAPWSGPDRLFAFWNQDFGVTVKDQNVSGIAINLITISGTINIKNYVDTVQVTVGADYFDPSDKNEDGQQHYIWLMNMALYPPFNNKQYSVIAPLFPSPKNNIKAWVSFTTGGSWVGGYEKEYMNVTGNISDFDIDIDIDLGEITVD